MQVVEILEAFLLGIIAMANFAIALIFFKFYRRAADRLFLLFGIAFCILGADRCALAFIQSFSERGTLIYTLRLLAFGIILFAIIDKNRSRSTR
jgi:hypothetical protein